MEWSDEALILSARPFGERARRVIVFTPETGKQAGLWRSSRQLQPGSRVRAHWRGRLAEHLGTLRIERVADSPDWLSEAAILYGGCAVLAVLEKCLPEREPHPMLYEASARMLDALKQKNWPVWYVRWECAVLSELGFPLRLKECALTGQSTELEFVSPRTGRAVSRRAAAPWRAQLLKLPEWLTSQFDAQPAPEEICDGLHLTGYFIARELTETGALPLARQRLYRYFQSQIP